MKKIFERIKASFYFHVVRKYLAYRPVVEGKQIFLTFDDGPEPGITEFVLSELAKYKAKGTFFCCGKNMEKHSDLLKRIKSDGHTIANHTYTHINGLSTASAKYVADARKVDAIHPTFFFRPPWGQMNFNEIFSLKDKKIVLWDVVSGDVEEHYNKDNLERMWREKVKSGSIILFHFSKQHEARTKDLLPSFMEIFNKEGFQFGTL